MKMFRYPRKDWTVTSEIISMDQLATTTVRSGDCNLVAHITACSSYHISLAALWRSYTHLVVQLREVIAHMVSELVA